MTRASPSISRLRLEIDLEVDGRVPLPDSYIVEALADALPEIDRQGLLFPGVDWPRSGERLRDWSVRLTGSGKRVVSPLEVAIEQRRREGDLSPRPAPASPAEAKLREEAGDILAAVDDFEPVVMERARTAWQMVAQLRHLAVRLELPASSAADIQAAIDEGRRLLATDGLRGISPEAL